MTCKGSFEKILSIIVCDKKVLYFALEQKIKIYPFVGSDSFANKGFSCRYAVTPLGITLFTNTHFREEMQKFQGSRNGVQSLLDRTRTSIRELSFSSASDLRNDLAQIQVAYRRFSQEQVLHLHLISASQCLDIPIVHYEEVHKRK